MKYVVAVFAALLMMGCGSTKAPRTDASTESDASDAGDTAAADAQEAPNTVDAPAVVDGGGDAAVGSASDAGDAGDAHVDAADANAAAVLPAECAKDTASPPLSLVCTGLYADIATKKIAASNAAYAPAIPLWSDGAAKERWIYLPPGTKIDNTDPNEWLFPIGTKVWKQFSRDGQRVETRLWQKMDATYWVDATYAWSADEAAATRTNGGDIPWGDGGTYHIPTPDECQKCHRGRTDRILGFEQGLLGLAGATGLTLDQLAKEGRLTVAPPSGPLTIGDDGTGLAAPALAWLHVNCGTTCHNSNSGSTAWATKLFMRLDASQLDGRSVKNFDTLTTTIGVPAVTPAWVGKTRIAAHDPSRSLLYQLISHRGTGNQMPPIATDVVDLPDVALVEAWIEQLSPLPTDGGTDTHHADAATDARGEAGSPHHADAGVQDAERSDDRRPDGGDASVDAPIDVASDVDAIQP